MGIERQIRIFITKEESFITWQIQKYVNLEIKIKPAGVSINSVNCYEHTVTVFFDAIPTLFAEYTQPNYYYLSTDD